MFTICDPGPAGCNRRAFIRIGALGLGGLSLSQVLGTGAAAAEKTLWTGRSVIFLFQHGGPSQFETFDPKMTAPEGIRSLTGAINTTLPGISFGSTFTQLAQRAHKLAVVRSYVPGDANHDAKPIVHRETLGANLGALYARVVGLNHPATGIPTNMLLYPHALGSGAQPPVQGLGNFPATGPLGNAYAPFMPGGGGDLQKNMRLTVARDRLDDRRALLAQFDKLRRHLDRTGAMETMDRYAAQAFDVILHGAADAFDLSKEDKKLVARYDTAPLVNIDRINKKWNNRKYYIDHARSVGKLLLLARRLCEAGCGFVTVNTNFVWDMHSDVNNAPPAEAMPYVGGPFDHAVSALIDDLERRGLSDRILLVCCGEMGRTPRVNKQGGRDHWGNLGPLLLHGGGLNMGRVIGRSDRDGGSPASDPVTLRNLIATIMHTLFNIGEVRLVPGISGDVSRAITEGTPIRQLIA
jgi:hypothetical protein